MKSDKEVYNQMQKLYKEVENIKDDKCRLIIRELILDDVSKVKEIVRKF